VTDAACTRQRVATPPLGPPSAQRHSDHVHLLPWFFALFSMPVRADGPARESSAASPAPRSSADEGDISPSEGWYGELGTARGLLDDAVYLLRAAPPQPLSTAEAELREARERYLFWSTAAELTSAELRHAEATLESLPGTLTRQISVTDAAAESVKRSCTDQSLLVVETVMHFRSPQGGPYPENKSPSKKKVEEPLEESPLFVAQHAITILLNECPSDDSVVSSIQMFDVALIAEADVRAMMSRIDAVKTRVSALRAEMDLARQRASTAQRDIAHISSELAESEGAVAPANFKARQAAASYARLQETVDDYRGRLPTDAWCEIWGLGGVAMAEAGQEDMAIDAFAAAAAAWNGACRPAVAQYLDLVKVQVAWATALYRLATREVAWVQIEAGNGDWRLDGQAITGATSRTLTLSPGPHRVELSGGLDDRQAILIELAPAEHLYVTAKDNRVEVYEFDAQQMAWIPPPPDTHSLSDSGRASAVYVVERDMEPHPLSTRLAVGLEGTWLVFDNRDHVGVTLTARYVLIDGGKADLLVGLAHDHLASDEHYRYTPTFSSRFLLRERALLGAQLHLGSVNIGVEGSVGVLPPLNGFIWQAGGRGSVHLSDAVRATLALAESGVAWNLDNVRPSPALSLGLAFQL